jgi:hypothetical protein
MRSLMLKNLLGRAYYVVLLWLLLSLVFCLGCKAKAVEIPKEQPVIEEQEKARKQPTVEVEVRDPRIPSLAYRLRRTVRGEINYHWGLEQDGTVFYAQIYQESCWNPGAKSAYASGLAQFTPDTATWISGLYPADLGDNNPLDVRWAIRALVRYDKWLYDKLSDAATERDRWGMTLSSYNGGLGNLVKDRQLCSASNKFAGSKVFRSWVLFDDRDRFFEGYFPEIRVFCAALFVNFAEVFPSLERVFSSEEMVVCAEPPMNTIVTAETEHAEISRKEIGPVSINVMNQSFTVNCPTQDFGCYESVNVGWLLVPEADCRISIKLKHFLRFSEAESKENRFSLVVKFGYRSAVFHGFFIAQNGEGRKCVKCDPSRWFDHVEHFSKRASWAFKENRDYVTKILDKWAPVYRQGGFV